MSKVPTEDENTYQVLSREIVSEIAKNIKIGFNEDSQGYKTVSITMPDNSDAYAIAQTVLLKHCKHDIA